MPPGGVEVFARDMTVTVAADVALEQLQRRLAEVNQWLPVDCAQPRQTIGELVDRHPSGPLRLGYGAWRDLLLGCQFHNGSGELITAGGRVVKNVAGYDLTKLMVGQHGVFAKLATLTARTYRLPEYSLSATFEPSVSKLNELLPTPLRPQWTLLTADSLTCGYLGDRRTIDYVQSRLAEATPQNVQPPEAVSMERPFNLFFGSPNGMSRFRAAVPPARIIDFIRAASVRSWQADPAFGIVVGDPADDDDRPRIRDAARAVGGTVIFYDADGAIAEAQAARGVASLLGRLKSAFDPSGSLNPLPGIVEGTKTA